MPVYEYHCPTCELRFEVLRPMSQSDSPAVCPRCETPNARRALSVFAAVSRGGAGSRLIASSGRSGCASCSSSQCATCGNR